MNCRPAFAESWQGQRPTQVEPELVAMKRRRLGGALEEIPRIEGAVAEELKNLAMKLVRAGTGGDVYDRAGVPSVFGTKGRVIGFELLHGIDRRLESDLVLDHVVEVDAVNHEVNGVLTTAGRVQAKRSLAAQRRRQKSILRRRYRTGNQQAEVDKVSSIQRDLLDRPLVDDLAHGNGGVLDHRRIHRDGHALIEAANLEREIPDHRPADFDGQIIQQSFESLH